MEILILPTSFVISSLVGIAVYLNLKKQINLLGIMLSGLNSGLLGLSVTLVYLTFRRYL